MGSPIVNLETIETKLMLVNEAARLLGVSESFLRRAEKKGRIPKARRDMNGWRVYNREENRVLFPEAPQRSKPKLRLHKAQADPW